MKTITIRMMQHASAVLLFLYCVFYSYFRLGSLYVSIGVFAWVAALLFLYFPNFLVFLGVVKDELKDAKKASILEGWIWALYMMSVLTGNRLLGILASMFLALLIAYCIRYFRNLRKAYTRGLVKSEGS